MNINKQLNKGDKMRKAILSLLVILSLGAALATPSQAYWSKQGNNVYWCTYGSYCR